MAGALVLLLGLSATAPAEPVIPQAGLAVIEAEDHDARIARDGRDWVPGGPPGAVGTSLRAMPDTGARITSSIATTSPELGYRVLLPSAGAHHLWLRVAGASNGNTLHAGLDGQVLAQNLAVAVGGWSWIRASVAVPSAGEHTLNVWMREDGMSLDRLVLTADAGFTPAGAGPPASPRGEPAPDTTPPALVGRIPAPGATGVAPGASVVATFSEAMSPASVAAALTLAPSAGGAAVPASVVASAGDTIFTLDPAADLAAGTAYTATLGTGAADAAGNPLAAPASWSFTTAEAPPPAPGAVRFAGGLAAVEAEDHDARVPRSSHEWAEVAGPAGAAGRAMQAAPDTGARITTAITTAGPELAYRVAFPSAGAHQLWLRVYGISNGNTLHAGLDGVASAQNLTVAPGAWRWVKAVVTVPSAGEHTVQAWMREDGLYLDRLVVTDDPALVPSGTGPAVTPREDPAPDTTPPAVVGRAPAPGAAGVAPEATAAATFSEPMDPATLTATTLTLAPAAGGAAVTGTVSVSADRTVATLDPAAPLALGTEYRVTVATGAADAAGNPLPAPEAWTFTTTPPDTTAPAVTGRSPEPGSTDVPVGATVVATFSEPMDPATLAGAFALAPAAGGPALAAAVVPSADARSVTLDPASPLAPETAYRATVGTAATDAAGNPLAEPADWTFTTGPAIASGTRTEITTGEMLGAAFNRRWFYVRRDGGAWEPTYADGLPAARGKLMNFRAANAIWDDEARSDDDPQANTDEFVSHFGAYRERGILGFTVSLQGGLPGYEGARASAFRPDGSLKPAWLARAAQVIEAADEHGQVVILTYFYQREDEFLNGADAVRAATRNATDWLIERGYRNVIIEVANEYNALLYDHEILKANRAVNGVAELILLAKSRFAGLGYRLPVSVSSRDMLFPGALREASDLVLVHGNLDAPRKDGPAVAKLVNDPTVHGPVVINEDFNGLGVAQSNLDEDRITASDVVAAGGSWGLCWRVYTQYYPFNWAVGSSPDIGGGSRANYFRAILDHMGRLTGDVTP